MTNGYAGKILHIDLGNCVVAETDTSQYSDGFLGGKGMATWIYWHEVPPSVMPFDPENRLIMATGPLCGVPVIGGSRWEVCGKSPTTFHGQFGYGNLGGTWGAYLKFAGYDALVVHGRSERPVYLVIRDGQVEFKSASHLWGKGAVAARVAIKTELGKEARVAAIGPAGENLSGLATILADNDASASCGLGAVMGSKHLKAIVVIASNPGMKVGNPDRLHDLTAGFRELRRCFPTDGWEYLSRWSRDPMLDPKVMPGPELRKDPCYGCLGNCARRVYQGEDGAKGKFLCHSAFFYQPWVEKYYGGWHEAASLANRLCDDYGLDAVAIDFMISWLRRCYDAGIITDSRFGIPISKVGSAEFIRILLEKVACRRGFGDTLARGVFRAARSLGDGAVHEARMAGHLAEPGYYPYGPRLYLTNALLYAMDVRMPIQQLHEIGLVLAKYAAGVKGLTTVTGEVIRNIGRRFWGSEEAADFTTCSGKAMAARRIQDRMFAEECLVLCNFLWPITDCAAAADGIGDPSLESRILSAVLGREISEDELYQVGERAFNLQRAVLAREGRPGRGADVLPALFHELPLEYDQANPECLVPGEGGRPVSRKGAVVDRADFERMKDEYYALRGWDVSTGLQTRKCLEGIGLGEVATELESRGLLARPDDEIGGPP